jgi:hypothetical protein
VIGKEIRDNVSGKLRNEEGIEGIEAYMHRGMMYSYSASLWLANVTKQTNRLPVFKEKIIIQQ